MPAKKKKKLGRRSLLETEPGLVERICERIQNGEPPSNAALCEGVSETTYYRWMDEGRTAEDAGEESIFRDFQEAVTRARALFRSQMIKDTTESFDAQGNRQHSKWLLEKLYREEFGHKIELQVKERAIEEVLDVVRQGVDTQTYLAVLQALGVEDSEPAP